MSCANVRAGLVDLLYAELDEDNRAGVSTHLEECAECWTAWLELRSVASALDRWTVPAPRGIAERVLAELAIREAGAAGAHGPTLAIPHLLALLLVGAGAAGVSLLVSGEASLRGETSLKVGLAGVLWTVLYAGAGFLVQHAKYHRLTLAALIAAGLSVLVAPVLSMPAVIEACRRWLEAAQGSVALNGAILLAGTLYAATPVFLSSAIIMAARPGGGAADVVRLAGIYGLLLAPSVYLQCHTLALSLTAPWIAGVLVGSLLGSTGGMAVACRRRSAWA
jgi:hypothetical protein